MTNWHAKALISELEDRLGSAWREQFETVSLQCLPTGTSVAFCDATAWLQDIEGTLFAVRFDHPVPQFGRVGPNGRLEWKTYPTKRRLPAQPKERVTA
jgi:hypothetical protein